MVERFQLDAEVFERPYPEVERVIDLVVGAFDGQGIPNGAIILGLGAVMAKRQQDLKDPAVRKRIEGFLRPMEEGVMAEKQEKVMAEGDHMVVGTEGEHVLLTLESGDHKVKIKFTFDEAEDFEAAFEKMRKRVGLRIEARRSKGAMRVDRVEEEDEDPGQGVAE